MPFIIPQGVITFFIPFCKDVYRPEIKVKFYVMQNLRKYKRILKPKKEIISYRCLSKIYNRRALNCLKLSARLYKRYKMNIRSQFS